MPIGRPLPVIRIREMTAIPKELLADIDHERQALTIRNVAKIIADRAGRASADQPDHYILYKEDDDYFYTPRNHKVVLCPEFVRGRHYVVRNETITDWRGSVVLGEDQVVLGPNDRQPFDQAPAYEALSALPTWPYGRMLVLRCGAGKTTIALKAAHARHARTLWVTVNTTLIEQVKPEITRCLGIPVEEIGHVQAAKCKWQGYSIAVAMLHSLALKTYPQEFYDYWDLVIFDEGDVLATKEFNHVVSRFRGERWLLTATDKRDDNMEVLFEKHIGPVCYKYTDYDLKPDCYVAYTDAMPDKTLVYAGWDPVRGEKRVCFPLVAKKLLENDQRNSKLYDLINKACEKGRTCLVLGGSVDGLAYACRGAKQALPHLTHGLVVGQVKQKERQAIIHGNDVVWATEALAYRGLDRPVFDTLIYATLTAVKKSRSKQGGGRILRAQKDKRPPMVILMCDWNVEPLSALALKMLRLFKQEKWPVHAAEKLYQMQTARAQARREDHE